MESYNVAFFVNVMMHFRPDFMQVQKVQLSKCNANVCFYIIFAFTFTVIQINSYKYADFTDCFSCFMPEIPKLFFCQPNPFGLKILT